MIGSVAGATFAAIHTPVPWLIGPLLAVAICNILGANLDIPHWMRSTGQWLLGIALGLHFVPSMVAQISGLLPYMVLAAFATIGFGFAGGWAMSRFGGIDRTTAHFAAAIGGAPEMAAAAEHAGANIDQVVSAHMLRVLLTVTVVPAAVQYGARLTPHAPTISLEALPSPSLIVLALTSLAGAALLRRFHFPNAYALVPLLLTSILLGTGVVSPGPLPRWISVGAQILVAVSLGIRFTPESLVASRRLLLPVGLYSFASIAYAGVGAAVLWMIAGLRFPTGVLSLAPGGMADMGIAAEALGLLVPAVIGFHVVRVIFVVLLTGPLLIWARGLHGRGLADKG